MADTTPATQPAMEDILSSIRTTMAEETAKVGSGSADLIDAAAEQDGEEDILELSASDMVGAPAAAADDELIDIAAFGSTGEAKAVSSSAVSANELDAPQIAPAAAQPVEDAAILGAADEFDRLLAEISQEQQQQVAASVVSKQALMDEEEPLGTEAQPVSEAEVEAEVAEDAVDAIEDAVVAEAVAAMTEPMAAAEPANAPAAIAMAPSSGSFSLGMVETAQGVQVAFPAEVLALALRPMVQDWLAKNLPGVVEKLVKEEISKLTQN